MHDIADLERRGVPSVFVASDQFVDAAAAQSAAMGVDAAAVFVAHPIQDRTDDEIRALADAAVTAIVSQVTTGPGPGAQATRRSNPA